MAFEGLAGAKYCLLTTYRASGEAVSTPVWFAVDGESLLICTDDPSGKVRRLRRSSRAAVAPCTLRGRRLGPDQAAEAALLAGDDAARAESFMHDGYSLGKRLFYRLIHPLVTRGKELAFIRVDPAG